MLQRIVDPMSPNMTATKLPLVKDVKTGTRRSSGNTNTYAAYSVSMDCLSFEIFTINGHLVEVTIQTLLVLERYARAFAPYHTVHRSAAGDQKCKRAAGKDFEKDPIELPA